MATPKTHATAIKRIRQAIRDMMDLPTPEPAETADLIGDLRQIEILLAEWRRGLLVETPDAEGQRYRTVTRRKAKRSYNTTKIIHSVATELDLDTLTAIRRLREAGAFKFTVRWTDLKKAFALWDLDLVTSSHEVADEGDISGAHVGEQWDEHTAQEPIEEAK